MSAVETCLREALEQIQAVELAVLFGSCARGEAHSASDVDVGVRVSEQDVDELRRVELVLGRAAGRTVDVVPLDSSPPLLRFEIARDGKVLIERRPYAWADFRARAMLDWWDWAPTARMIHAAAVRRLSESVGHGST
jgi:predicted nucleotidyltransferase